MQLDMDYTNTINNLKNKLRRQKLAVEQTEGEIAGFEKLREMQLKDAAKK